jgi:hypothetical protein
MQRLLTPVLAIGLAATLAGCGTLTIPGADAPGPSSVIASPQPTGSAQPQACGEHVLLAVSGAGRHHARGR